MRKYKLCSSYIYFIRDKYKYSRNLKIVHQYTPKYFGSSH